MFATPVKTDDCVSRISISTAPCMRMQQSKEDVLTAGREFALFGLDKYGKVTVFKDTDTYSAMITANIKIEGYQFMLIYMDEIDDAG